MENLQDKYSLVLALKIAYSCFCLGKILCLNWWSLEVAGLLSTGHRISEVARYYGRVWAGGGSPDSLSSYSVDAETGSQLPATVCLSTLPAPNVLGTTVLHDWTTLRLNTQ